jgi:hypothetical protein
MPSAGVNKTALKRAAVKCMAMPSTVIASYQYDAAAATLEIVYRSGAVYRYRNVPPDVYAAFKAYREKGVYLNKYIKGKFPYQKIS